MNPEIYYDDGAVRVRDMIVSDARIITDAEIAQGWHATVDKYLTRLAHQRRNTAGKSRVTSTSIPTVSRAPSREGACRRSWTSACWKSSGAGASAAN